MKSARLYEDVPALIGCVIGLAMSVLFAESWRRSEICGDGPATMTLAELVEQGPQGHAYFQLSGFDVILDRAVSREREDGSATVWLPLVATSEQEIEARPIAAIAVFRSVRDPEEVGKVIDASNLIGTLGRIREEDIRDELAKLNPGLDFNKVQVIQVGSQYDPQPHAPAFLIGGVLVFGASFVWLVHTVRRRLAPFRARIQVLHSPLVTAIDAVIRFWRWQQVVPQSLASPVLVAMGVAGLSYGFITLPLSARAHVEATTEGVMLSIASIDLGLAFALTGFLVRFIGIDGRRARRTNDTLQFDPTGLEAGLEAASETRALAVRTVARPEDPVPAEEFFRHALPAVDDLQAYLRKAPWRSRVLQVLLFLIAAAAVLGFVMMDLSVELCVIALVAGIAGIIALEQRSKPDCCGMRFEPFPIEKAQVPSSLKRYAAECTKQLDELGFQRLGDFALKRGSHQLDGRYFLAPDGRSFVLLALNHAFAGVEFWSVLWDGSCVSTTSLDHPVDRKPTRVPIYIRAMDDGAPRELWSAHEEQLRDLEATHGSPLEFSSGQLIAASDFDSFLSAFRLVEQGTLKKLPARALRPIPTLDELRAMAAEVAPC